MEGKNSMKKVMKILCVFALIFLAGCSSKSQDEQKQVVTDFFTYVEKCDTKGLKKVTSSSVLSKLNIEKMEKQLSQYSEEQYGKVFVEETNKFKKAIFKDFFSNIKIKDVKEDGDKVKVSVTGKEKDYTKLDFDTSEFSTIFQDYIKEHYSEIMKVYQEEGETAANIKVFDEIAPTFYEKMTEAYKKVPTKSMSSTLTLEEKDGQWIITGIDE